MAHRNRWFPINSMVIFHVLNSQRVIGRENGKIPPFQWDDFPGLHFHWVDGDGQMAIPDEGKMITKPPELGEFLFWFLYVSSTSSMPLGGKFVGWSPVYGMFLKGKSVTLMDRVSQQPDPWTQERNQEYLNLLHSLRQPIFQADGFHCLKIVCPLVNHPAINEYINQLFRLGHFQ